MYVSGLGQITGGYNPCGVGYAFVNFQCIHDPNCDFSGGGGFGICPSGYLPIVAGTYDNPVSDAELKTLLAQALASSVTNPVYPVASTPPVAPTPLVAAASPVAPAASAAAPAGTAGTSGIPTWALLLAGAGVALWLWSDR
jgi:hypothetical protein